MNIRRVVVLWAVGILCGSSSLSGQVLDKRKQLTEQTFWDNRDWSWYEEQIPFFECPDAELTTTYYYRWELLTKHLTYGSPNSGYSFTEFIDRPFWSGAYGAISCPAGHQLYEARWLRQPRIARDYMNYWLRTPGAQPRNYSTWLADSAWSIHQVHGERRWVTEWLDGLIANYEGWEKRHFVPEVGLFWQTGHDDGMEFNINSRQTKDILRGAPSYRPSFNAYMWADAVAIAKIARLVGKEDVAIRFEKKSDGIKSKMLELLWDEKREFFFPVFKNDEEREGYKIRKLTKTYEDGQYAGDPHGRELIGYVPWQFQMIEHGKGYERAWLKLMDRDGFYADFGPSTVERNDPMFLLQKSCCWWSGQSWPYATTQTLKGMAYVLQDEQKRAMNERSAASPSKGIVSKEDYFDLLSIYSKSHRKNGKPYLAEALHPDTGSFEGHDGYNHSEHYFHSGFCDLIITGLVGISPRDDDVLEVRPLAPNDWDYFALDDVAYRGHRVSIVWDRKGDRYGQGAGFHLMVDGRKVASSPNVKPLEFKLSSSNTGTKPPDSSNLVATNFAVNNDGTYFPRITASYTSNKTSVGKLNDGNYWYLQHPPNRWTCEGSPNDRDWVEVDFGVARSIHTLKAYPLDDAGESNSKVRAPAKLEWEIWSQGKWQPLQRTKPEQPEGHRANVVSFDPVEVTKVRLLLHHPSNGKAGLSELEAWGDVALPLEPAAPPMGNLAYNPKLEGFPKATASFSDRFGGKPSSAIDGRTVFLPSPMNRWTSYESKSESDWLEIDFGKPTEFRRVELAIYDDRGGVQPPSHYVIEYWKEEQWHEVAKMQRSPEKAVGSQWNEARFEPVTSSKLRIVFTHQGKARSGVSEVMVWNE